MRADDDPRVLRAMECYEGEIAFCEAGGERYDLLSVLLESLVNVNVAIGSAAIKPAGERYFDVAKWPADAIRALLVAIHCAAPEHEFELLMRRAERVAEDFADFARAEGAA